MRIWEMKNKGILPTKAGKVSVLKFGDFKQNHFKQNQEMFFRMKNVIYLYNSSKVEMFFIKNDEQFLMIYKDGKEVWFGGTDENAFLVRLDTDVLNIFMSNGEEGFFEALTPPLIRDFSEQFEVGHQRQGDIFYVQAPFGWKEIESSLRMIKGSKGSVKPKETSKLGFSVFGTRHILKGRFMSDIPLLGYKKTTLIEGKLKAPDHTTRILKGPHIISQTQYLYDPLKAD